MQGNKSLQAKADLKRGMSSLQKNRLTRKKAMTAYRSRLATIKSSESKSFTINAMVSQANSLKQTQPSKSFEKSSLSKTSNMYNQFNSSLVKANTDLNTTIIKEYESLATYLENANRNLIQTATASVSAYAQITENAMKANNYDFINKARSLKVDEIKNANTLARTLIDEMTRIGEQSKERASGIERFVQADSAAEKEQFSNEAQQMAERREKIFSVFLNPSVLLDVSEYNDILRQYIGATFEPFKPIDIKAGSYGFSITLNMCDHCDGAWQGNCEGFHTKGLDLRKENYNKLSIRLNSQEEVNEVVEFLQKMGFGVSKMTEDNNYLIYFTCRRAILETKDARVGNPSHWCDSVYAGAIKDELFRTLDCSTVIDGLLMKNNEQPISDLCDFYKHAWLPSLNGFSKKGRLFHFRGGNFLVNGARLAGGIAGGFFGQRWLSPVVDLALPSEADKESIDLETKLNEWVDLMVSSHYLSKKQEEATDSKIKPYFTLNYMKIPTKHFEKNLAIKMSQTNPRNVFNEINFINLHRLNKEPYSFIDAQFLDSRANPGVLTPDYVYTSFEIKSDKDLLERVCTTYWLKIEGYYACCSYLHVVEDNPTNKLSKTYIGTKIVEADSIYFPKANRFANGSLMWDGPYEYQSLIYNLNIILSKTYSANLIKESVVSEVNGTDFWRSNKFGADHGLGFVNIASICGIINLNDLSEIGSGDESFVYRSFRLEKAGGDDYDKVTHISRMREEMKPFTEKWRKPREGVQQISHIDWNLQNFRQIIERINRQGLKNRCWWVNYLFDKYLRLRHICDVSEANKVRADSPSVHRAQEVKENFDKLPKTVWYEQIDLGVYNKPFTELHEKAGFNILKKFIEIYDVSKTYNVLQTINSRFL